MKIGDDEWRVSVSYETFTEVVGNLNLGATKAVLAKHKSGVTVFADCARSQLDNKQICDEMILAALTHPKFNPD